MTSNELALLNKKKKAAKIMQLHQKGKIPDEVVILFGMSGELPEKSVYSQFTPEEKQSYWENRMASNLGDEPWKRSLNRLPAMFQEIMPIHNWLQEGF